MQAYRAYYEEGKFVPFEPVKVVKGSQAIVTVLDFPIEDMTSYEVSIRQKKALARFREAMRNSDPLTPEFDEVMTQRVTISRELDL